MPTRRFAWRRRLCASGIVLALAGPAEAQVSTSTVKGQVTDGTAAAQAGLVVTAVNQANGASYRTATLADGSYVLAGLAPGAYEIRVAPAAAGTAAPAQTITLQVGETASLDLSLAAAATALAPVTVTGSARQGVRDSQVGTYVSPRMIQALPQATHNFLSSADLAPGVAFVQDAAGNTKLQSGAQSFDHTNVFIDGVGQKNNVLRGGLTGQDSSRGNPFPQSAIAEYRVLTQNYKAEFEQVSSAAISAITKSGTNELHGDAYVDRTGTNWRARTPFEKEREAQGIPLPPSSKNEYGFSVGGPIKPDVLHFFVAYDGKRIEDSRQVTPQNLDLLPAGAGIVPSLSAAQGNAVDHFRQDLLFGKLDARLSEDQRLSASFKLRRETDHLPEERRLSAPDNAKDRGNDETRIDLKHEWTIGSWLSEARIGYEDAVWKTESTSNTPFIKYKASTANPPLLSASQDVIFVGGSPDAQRRRQKGPYISEELTYTGLKQHVLKAGLKVKAMKYELSGTAFSVDTVETVIDSVTGLPYYDGTNCLGTTIINNGTTSDQCNIRRAAPGATAAFDNTQIGLYIQDDWQLTRKLELNLGLRYDYETNMLNNDYTTPADRVAALFAPDTRNIGGIVAATPGQTYAQSLALGGVDISQYISTGNSRKVYKGAIAPRLGASYDIFGDRESVVFGGYGRSYDRTIATHALDEMQKNAQAGGEIWLIKNDFKMPYADQFTLGLRQALGKWNGEIALGRVNAKNQFVWFFGNRDPAGGYAFQSPIDALFGGPDGFGSLILGDFVGETKTDSLYLKAEKPYSRESGWGLTFAYTYSDARTTNNEWNNDNFDATFGKPLRRFHPSTLVDKHRLVAAAVVDGLLPWGLTFAAKATWGSGYPRRIVYCPGGFTDVAAGRVGTCDTLADNSPSFRQVDIGIGKEMAWGIHRFSVRADVLNVFNTVNYGGFDDFAGAPPASGNPTNAYGGDNLNVGKPNVTRGDPRTLRVSVGYRF